VQGCQQGNVPGMQGPGPAWFGAQWIPQQQTFMQQTSQARVPSYGCAALLIFKSYEIKVFYLSITGGYGIHIGGGQVRYGTVVRALGYGYGMSVRALRYGYGV